MYSIIFVVRYRGISRLNSAFGTIRAQASNVSIGSGGYEDGEKRDNQKSFVNGPSNDNSSEMWVMAIVFC